MTNEIGSLDLSECDAEPIHLIGSIRPSGCMLAVHRQNLTIHYVSDNIQTLFPQQPTEMLGKPLRSFITEEVSRTLLPIIRGAQLGDRRTERFRWNPNGYEKVSLIHLAPCEEVVLIEVMLQDDPVSEVTDRFHRTVDLKALGEITDLGVLMDQVATNVRKFTDFDRVMVYRFADDGSGYVAAESTRNDIESYLGLHYPAADIPAQARRLFVVNRVRIVEDVQYKLVPILGHRSEANELDLSASMLRSVSPIHLRYLSNMGVGASLAISLVRDGQLWGMIACHHYSPKSLPPCMLGFTEMLSQVLSVMADRVERTNRSSYSASCIDRVDKAMQKITIHKEGLVEGIHNSLRLLANAIAADGLVLVRNSESSQYGDCLLGEQIDSLVTWLESRDESLVVTDRLVDVWPEASVLEIVTAGMLALRWTANSWLIFFRNEIVQSVFWAGNPNNPVDRDTDGRLSPRGSFEAWKEDVRGQSRKWQGAEIDALRPLRRLSAVQDIADAAMAHEIDGTIHGRTRDPVLIVDLEGTVLDWNYAVEQRFGISDLAGKQLENMLPFVSPDNLSALLKDASTGEVWIGEYQKESDQGTYEVVVFPIGAKAANAQRVGVAMRDVSERKILEQHLHQAQKMEALGQLTSGMVHNFNNLLTVIINSTELALAHLSSDHPSYVEVRAARTASTSAARIVRDLMSFAADKLASRSEVNVGHLVNQQREILKYLVRSEIKITFDIATTDTCANANGYQLEQVLVNLIANACDAIEGSGQILVRVFCEYVDEQRSHGLKVDPANYVVVSVEDSGGGIDAEVIERIFDPFFSTKSSDKGSGLGLSSAASIVKSFGGSIRVHSKAHNGSQFMIYLPQIESANWTPDKQTFAGKSVLIVDDEHSVAASLASLLTVTGCKVHIAESGSDALAMIGEPEFRIDMLVTDQTMPDMSGLDLIKNVRAQLPNIPLMLMSGIEMDISESKLLKNLTFVNKPCDPMEFLQIVAEKILHE